MPWNGTRTAGSLYAARRLAHSDDGKNRKDESTGLKQARFPRWVPVALASVLVLGGAVVVVSTASGGSEAEKDNPTAASASTTASPSASATPSPDPQATAPSGRYRFSGKVEQLRPPTVQVEPTFRGSVTFRPAACDSAGLCSGQMVSNSGATYSYTWDGRNLALDRAAIRQKIPCEDSDGFIDVRRTFSIPEVEVQSTPTGRPSRIAWTFDQRVTVLRVVNCTIDQPHALKFERDQVVATPAG